jgi:hypothetical protein
MLKRASQVAGPGSLIARAGIERIEPAPAMLIRALRQIGYSFEQAVSDIIDNSISAGAETILVRFIAKGEAIRSIAIADDGVGMTAARLSDAMRFGSETDLSRRTLGKFGMGLKLASLSHAQTLTVVSVRDGNCSGRRWSVEGIGRDWSCDELSADGAFGVIAAPWSDLNLTGAGTVVVWDDIDLLPTGKNLRETLKRLQRRLQLHLGMTFHRFLEGLDGVGRLKIVLDLQIDGEAEHPHRVEIRPLNPFGYPESGHPEYPQVFPLEVAHDTKLHATAFLWPANSDSDEYKLGNRTAARQGFYFYRNDRLIQAGGWNGLVQSDSEPHSSLARVSIDLPESLDSVFGLNVQKSAILIPPNFLSAVASAISIQGQSFEEYRRAAQQVYRHKDTRAQKHMPVVPGRGLPVAIRRMIEAQRCSSDDIATPIDFVWAELADRDSIFEIDRTEKRILLSSRLRQAGGHAGESSGSEKILKLCLFFLLQDEVLSERTSSSQQQKLDLLNSVFGHALLP